MVELAQRTCQHWLVTVALRAQLKGAEQLDCSSETAIGEAWRRTAGACNVTDSGLARIVADDFGLPVADFDSIDPAVITCVPEALARRCLAFPLQRDGPNLVVATSNPLDLEAEHLLEFASGRATAFAISPPAVLRDVIDTRYSPEHLIESLLARVDPKTTEAVRFIEDHQCEELTLEDATAGPVVKLTNQILRDAVRQRASDIHIQPDPAGATVRFRVDGVVRHYLDMPMPVLRRIVSRLKILSGLRVTQRLKPQDGKARIAVAGRRYDLRIATLPSRDAEKATIRILDPEGFRGLNDLEMPPTQLHRVEHLLNRREGMVVISGPTGSGKTTTLYARLRELADGPVNIMTAEDPIEYDLPGMTQIQVDPLHEMTFPSVLRAIMRHDPDIILVGEIRDTETARVAVQAGMTGHQVLTTMHTNYAAGIPAALVDLGVDRSAVAESFNGALAQRLLRRVCRECCETVTGGFTPEEARLAAVYDIAPIVRTTGCDACCHTGYRGRIPVAEILHVDPHIKELIYVGAHSLEIEQAAVLGGMRLIHDVAIERVRAGDTTLQEIDRVFGNPSSKRLR